MTQDTGTALWVYDGFCGLAYVAWWKGRKMSRSTSWWSVLGKPKWVVLWHAEAKDKD